MHELLAFFTYHPVQRWGPVSPHGVGTAVGFFLGAWLMARRAEQRGIPRPESYNAVTWGAIGAILGARGFYVLGHVGQFRSFTDMLAVWRGGLTMFGGFAGGLALGLLYMRRHGHSIVQTLEAAAPGFVVGVIVGRIGDLIIADHLGRPTHFVLGYRIPSGAELAPGYGPPTYVPGAIVHHTALYDLFGALILLGFLYWLQRKPRANGTLFAAFALWYGLQRFFIDFTRNRELIESVFFGLSGSQWAALAFAAGGIVALVRINRRKPTLPPPTAGPVQAVPVPAIPSSPSPVREASAAVEPPPQAPPPSMPSPSAPGEPVPAPSEATEPEPPPSSSGGGEEPPVPPPV